MLRSVKSLEEGGGTDVMATIKPIRPPTTRERIHIFNTFFLLGLSCIVTWSMFTNMVPSTLQVVFPGQGSFTDMVFAFYHSFLFVGCLLASFKPITKVAVMSLGLLSLIISSYFHICISLFATVKLAPTLIYVFATMAAISLFLLIAGLFTVAAVIPYPCIGSLAAGVGFSGVVSAGLWSLIPYAIMRAKTAEQLRLSMAICMTTTSLIVLSALIYWHYFLNMKWTRSIFDDYKTSSICLDFRTLSDTVYGDLEEEFYKSGYTGIIRRSWKPLIVRCFAYFQTFIIFPAISPVYFKLSLEVRDALIIVYQLTEFVSRYVTHMVPQMHMTENVIFVVVLSRMLFIAFYLVMAILQDSVTFFTNGPFHIFMMIILAFTNGWLGSSSAIMLPQKNQTVLTKMITSIFGLAISYGGVTAAQWLSKLLKIAMS